MKFYFVRRGLAGVLAGCALSAHSRKLAEMRHAPVREVCI